MTDLVERYVHAVGQYLPQPQRTDVIAELRANLLEEIDYLQETKGTALTPDEVAAVLRRHGKPEVVALRYLPQQSLIGPAIYPFYKFTVLRVLPLVVFACFVAQCLQFVAGRTSPAPALWHLAWSIAVSALVSLGIMTAIFALIDRARERGQLGKSFTEWDPMKLPPVTHTIPQADSARSTAKKLLDLVLHCTWFAYVLWVPWHPFWLMGPGVFVFSAMNVGLAPVWHTFYAALLVLLTLGLVLRIAVFLPGASRWGKKGDIAIKVLGWLALGILCTTSTYFVPVGGNANLGTLNDVNHGISIATRIAFVVALAGSYKEFMAWWRTRNVGQVAL